MNGATRCALAACLLSWCAWQAGAAEPPPLTVAPSGPDEPLVITDLVVGVGDEALPGMVCIVHYTGWLYDAAAADHKGLKFETSVGGTPFTFVVGIRQVIPGWEQGVPGMKVGGVRRLVVPSSLAYGASRNHAIPPYATLVFDIELLDVTKPE